LENLVVVQALPPEGGSSSYACSSNASSIKGKFAEVLQTMSWPNPQLKIMCILSYIKMVKV
jgi:hypothetical protein